MCITANGAQATLGRTLCHACASSGQVLLARRRRLAAREIAEHIRPFTGGGQVLRLLCIHLEACRQLEQKF